MMNDFAHGLLARCARWPEGLELFQVGLRVYRDGAFHDLLGLDIDDFRLADLRPGFLVLFLLFRNLLVIRGGGGLTTSEFRMYPAARPTMAATRRGATCFII